MRSTFEKRQLKYAASINDESLAESTDPDFELKYVDIGNVDSQGNINELTVYPFKKAPSRARRKVKHGDVIISTVRTYLQAITTIKEPEPNLIVSTGFAVVRPKTDLLSDDYFKYAVRESRFLDEVQAKSKGVSYPAINSSELADILISLPSLEEQKLIADYLDRETTEIDNLIAEKEKMLALLEEKREALISLAVTRGLDSNISLKRSGLDWLGDIPKHWHRTRLKHLAKEPLAYGANEAALEDNPSYPRFIRITDIKEDGSLRLETFKSLSPEVAQPYLLNDGDVLLARSGATVGKAFIYRREWGKACFAGYLIRCRCSKEKLIPDFLFYYTQSNSYWSQIYAGTIQATIQNFSGEKYGDVFMPIPPLPEQQNIVNYLDYETSKIVKLLVAIRESIALLKERRSALITAAVTGQIKLEDMTA